tara:strand:+ start:5126 stop:5584 length:459 start_codon:yes stop_codon:yes gene_type:complete
VDRKMIVLLQRVKEASVYVNLEIIGNIKKGLLIYIGVSKNDTYNEAILLANKCANIRIFNDNSGKMNRSLLETQGSCLIVSQFTLCANTSKGQRPSFMKAANSKKAKKIYNSFINQFHENKIKVATGLFGENMDVHSVNDGPVTLIINSNNQ